ncbi:MAG: SDR family NAD(P)-dependent oxidoreductase [Acidimicrobiia bacterium]
MGQLDDRVALVTGSTRGIGRAIAERFAAEGAKVAVNGRGDADVEAAAAAIPGSFGVAADLGDRVAAAGLVQRVLDHWGRIDVLVNNAAIAPRTAITRVTDEEWDTTIAVNLTAPMVITRATVPAMKQAGRGVILNVISGAGITGTIGFSSYAASKGGLAGLTMTLAQELPRFGIRANCLSPAALTDMLRQLPPELLDNMVKAGLPTVEGVADVALFLCSDQSRYTNGQILGVGGTGAGAGEG